MAAPKPEASATHASLLDRVRHLSDHVSWEELHARYRRLICQVAREAGLTETETDDVVQETLICLMRRMPEFRYDPAVCKFRTWLRKIVERRIVDQYRKRGKRRHEIDFESAGQERGLPIEEIVDPRSTDLASAWDTAFDRHLIERALEEVRLRVRPDHFQIYDFCVLREMSVAKVVRLLRVNPAQVYLVRHRVAKRVAAELGKLKRACGEDGP